MPWWCWWKWSGCTWADENLSVTDAPPKNDRLMSSKERIESLSSVRRNGHAPESTYDVIVVGLGTMGAAAAWQLSRRGYRVLGLEQFGAAHREGSHSGQTRLVRKAYFEHPDYVPLLEMAYREWLVLEADTGSPHYFETGLLYMAPAGHPLPGKVLLAAEAYGLPVEALSAEECRRRFPAFAMPDHFRALWEPAAGFVLAETSVRSFIAQARRHGAVLRMQEPVLQWAMSGDKVVVQTPAARYTADRLVLAGGAWSDRLVPLLKDRLVVTRQILAWIDPVCPDLFSMGNFPCWCLADGRFPGICYGFPALSADMPASPAGCKIAHHAPGPVIQAGAARPPVLAAEKEVLTDCLRRFLPEAGTAWSHFDSCLYTYSPDEDFLLDRLPGTEGRVLVAAGFSGHGFKFAPAVGSILADLATTGRTAAPIGFLGLARFQ